MARQFYGLATSLYLGFLLILLGVLTWATGLSILLPSLGPSAYALATKDDDQFNVPSRVIGGQVIGLVSAYVSTLLFLGGVSAASVPPLSRLGLLQVVATFLAIVVTTIGQFATDLQHPPAYATVLIVSLGLLNSPVDLVYFTIGVMLLVGTHELAKRYSPFGLPYDSWR